MCRKVYIGVVVVLGQMSDYSAVVPKPVTYLLTVGRDKTRSELFIDMRVLAQMSGTNMSDEIWDAMYMYVLRWKRDNGDRTAEYKRMRRILKEEVRPFHQGMVRSSSEGGSEERPAPAQDDLDIGRIESDVVSAKRRSWAEGMEVEDLIESFDKLDEDKEGDEV